MWRAITSCMPPQKSRTDVKTKGCQSSGHLLPACRDSNHVRSFKKSKVPGLGVRRV